MTLVLAGIAISSVMTAGIDAVVTLVPDALAGYSDFRIGGFAGVTLQRLGFALPFWAAPFSLQQKALRKTESFLLYQMMLVPSHSGEGKAPRIFATVGAMSLMLAESSSLPSSKTEPAQISGMVMSSGLSVP